LIANLSRLTEAPAPRPGAGVTATPSQKALQGYPYDAGSTGRRATAWQATRLGQNTLLWSNLDNIRARSRDAVRNNPWAASALDHFESNVIGVGIQPHWRHKDPKIIEQIQGAWSRWQEDADFCGQLDFYGLQAVMAREIFEAGEVFVRYRLRPPADRLYIPLQLASIPANRCITRKPTSSYAFRRKRSGTSISSSARDSFAASRA
jgi:capsid protein